MEKVYLLTTTLNDDGDKWEPSLFIEGVFSSRENAESFAEDGMLNSSDYMITSMTVDNPYNPHELYDEPENQLYPFV